MKECYEPSSSTARRNQPAAPPAPFDVAGSQRYELPPRRSASRPRGDRPAHGQHQPKSSTRLLTTTRWASRPVEGPAGASQRTGTAQTCARSVSISAETAQLASLRRLARAVLLRIARRCNNISAIATVPKERRGHPRSSYHRLTSAILPFSLIQRKTATSWSLRT